MDVGNYWDIRRTSFCVCANFEGPNFNTHFIQFNQRQRFTSATYLCLSSPIYSANDTWVADTSSPLWSSDERSL